MEILAINKTGRDIIVDTEGLKQPLVSEAPLQVLDQITFLVIGETVYRQIVGEFVKDGRYIVENGEQSNRIVFQLDLPGGVVVAFQAV